MEYFISWTCLDSCRTRGFHLPLCRVGRGSATGNNTVMWNTRLFTVAAVPSPKFTLPVSVSMIEPNILAGHSTTQWKDYCVLLQLNTAIWQVLVSKIEGKVFSGTFRESPKGGGDSLFPLCCLVCNTDGSGLSYLLILSKGLDLDNFLKLPYQPWPDYLCLLL